MSDTPNNSTPKSKLKSEKVTLKIEIDLGEIDVGDLKVINDLPLFYTSAGRRGLIRLLKRTTEELDEALWDGAIHTRFLVYQEIKGSQAHTPKFAPIIDSGRDFFAWRFAKG